jgi:hypothetical protein
MMDCPDGFYDGEITAAWVEEDDRPGKEELRVHFHVRLTTGATVECRHGCSGDWLDKTMAVVQSLGLVWPDALETIQFDALKKPVRVAVKNKQAGEKNYVNAYIVVRKAMDLGTLRERIAAMKAQAPPAGY